MKISALTKLREKLSRRQACYGLWITLESASITEMAVALGLDWVAIDAEHGHLDWKDVLAHIRAAVRSNTVVLVRVAELNQSLIKRALDIGADGVIVPWIETPAQLRQAVAFSHYPPQGVRGIGAERATGWGENFLAHARDANQHVLVVPMMETVTAGKNLEALCAVPGVEIFFFGPMDYASTAGFPGQSRVASVEAELLSIKDGLIARGKSCGILAGGSGDAARRQAEGFRVIGLGLDTNLLLQGLHAALAAMGRDRPIHPELLSPE